MRYVRCKCGASEGWTSMGRTRCFACPECGSDMAESPKGHLDPLPHDFSSSIEQQTEDGPITVPVCRYCHRTKWEIENGKREAP